MTGARNRAGTITVTAGSFHRLRRKVLSIRDEVFVRGMGVPLEIEHDSRDRDCLQVLVEVDGVPAATGRLDAGMDGKVGRVAVLSCFRGMGLGTRVMTELERAALRKDIQSLWCHAQLTAVEFYLGLGWRRTGPEFMEAGIEHVRMEKDLKGASRGG